MRIRRRSLRRGSYICGGRTMLLMETNFYMSPTVYFRLRLLMGVPRTKRMFLVLFGLMIDGWSISLVDWAGLWRGVCLIRGLLIFISIRFSSDLRRRRMMIDQRCLHLRLWISRFAIH